ncbi:MAG: cation:proton antiporter [Myxococcales bacterium]|nr:cation:proton antiporter [Myxococcales bacterium]
MNEPHLLVQLLVLLAITAAGLALFERLRLPSIAGFLVVGAVAGPGGLELVETNESVRALAEIGVVFLLFEIGLELPLERLRALWRTALLAGGAQVVLTVAVVAAGARALGLEPASALVLGGVVSMSSTALAMRLLVAGGTVDAPQGRLAVAILLLQDLAIVPFLLAIPLLGDAGGSLAHVAAVVGRMALALVAMLLVVRGVVPRVLDRAARLRSPDLFSLLALLVVLGSAVAAEMLGLTLAVGAFLAGVAATASPYSHQLFSEVVPLRGVLIGVFFTAVGMLFEPAALLAQPGAVAAYLAVAVGAKGLLIALVAAPLAREHLRTGVLTAAALAQTGEFSFVLADAARAAGALDPSLHQVVIAGSILSLLATPFLVRAAPALADRLTGRAPRDAASAPTAHGGERAADAAPEERAVVIGFGHAGRTIARTLRSLGIDYVVVESNASAVEAARERGEPIHYGDATRPVVLAHLGVARAKLVAVAISDPLATRRIVSRIHAFAPHTPVLARVRYVKEIELLEDAGARAIVAEEYEAALELVARVLAFFAVPSAAVRSFTDALREEGYDALRGNAGVPIDPWLVELLEQVDTSWVDVPADFAPTSLAVLGVRARTGVSVLAVERVGSAMPNPPPGFEIRGGDRLLVLGDAPALARLEALLAAPAA